MTRRLPLLAFESPTSNTRVLDTSRNRLQKTPEGDFQGTISIQGLIDLACIWQLKLSFPMEIGQSSSKALFSRYLNQDDLSSSQKYSVAGKNLLTLL